MKHFSIPFCYDFDPYSRVGQMDKDEANAKYQPKRSQKIKNKRKGKKRK
jgi:hypothetical protein